MAVANAANSTSPTTPATTAPAPNAAKRATAEWVAAQLDRRVGAPYFMVTFTLPQELRGGSSTPPPPKPFYDLLFASASQSLTRALAGPRWLGAVKSGFTLVLHTWNQRLGFHPHLHGIVPGARASMPRGASSPSRTPTSSSPFPSCAKASRQTFRTGLAALRAHHALPPVDPAVWGKDWGVHLQPFGDGTRAIQYLGAYICRTAISDARIRAVSDTHVTFPLERPRPTIPLRAPSISKAPSSPAATSSTSSPKACARCAIMVTPHPAAKATRERVAFHTGRPLHLPVRPPKPTAPAYPCPCCGETMTKLPLSLLPLWKTGPLATPKGSVRLTHPHVLKKPIRPASSLRVPATPLPGHRKRAQGTGKRALSGRRSRVALSENPRDKDRNGCPVRPG